MDQRNNAMPDSGGDYGRYGILSRIYHDIGLAAVAEALNILRCEFDPELNRALRRGEFYLLPGVAPAEPL